MVSDSSSSKHKEEGSNRRVTPSFHQSYSDVFNQVFPYYLSIGMSYEMFWDWDCTLVKAYREADKLKLERQNTMLWLQGQYIYEAILDVSPILHAFAKKGAKPVPYRSEPYPITREAVEDKEEQDAKKVFDKGKDYLKAFMEQAKKKKTEEVT